MFFKASKGIIALDIDGTITDQAHTIHSDVIDYFHTLAKEWQFIFVTGRSFQWGFQVLQFFSFPYVFAVQNGALILQMPDKKVLSRKYLTTKVLPKMEEICRTEATDFVIYSGWEYNDLCYFRPQCFSSDLLTYVEERHKKLNENWYPLYDFQQLPISQFLSLKCFASNAKDAFGLSQRIETELGLHAPVNRDPFNPAYFVIQVTHPEANKGEALRAFIQSNAYSGPILAAGDDYNDLSMLELADVRVVMADAPEAIKKIAHIIAPSATENGIITGLNLGLKMLGQEKGIPHVG